MVNLLRKPCLARLFGGYPRLRLQRKVGTRPHRGKSDRQAVTKGKEVYEALVTPLPSTRTYFHGAWPGEIWQAFQARVLAVDIRRDLTCSC